MSLSRMSRMLPRNFLVMLGAVAALLAGLLAMHSFSLDNGHAPNTATTSHHETDAVAHADCSGDCDPGHSMTAMACVLTLLITILLLAAGDGVARAGWLAAVARRLILYRDTAIAARAPSLDALSISRT